MTLTSRAIPAHDARSPALSAPPDALKANSASSCGLAGGGRRPRLGLHPTVTSQYSSTTLYQVSYHIQ